MYSRTDLCGGCQPTGIPTATHFVHSCAGMWEAPQVPNPKSDPEMAPIYGAQDDWPPSFFLTCEIRHLRCLPHSGGLCNQPFYGRRWRETKGLIPTVQERGTDTGL